MAREAKHFMKHNYNNGKSAIPREDSIIMKGFLKEGFFFKVNFEIVYCRKKQGISDSKMEYRQDFKIIKKKLLTLEL